MTSLIHLDAPLHDEIIDWWQERVVELAQKKMNHDAAALFAEFELNNRLHLTDLND